MNMIMKTVLFGLVCAGVGTAAMAVTANESGCREKAAHRDFRHDQGSFMERMEQRKTELHDKLKLKPEQEAAWTVFTGKMKPALPKERPDWAELRKLPVPERMDKMLEMMKAHEGRMEEHIAAVKDFYATLTPEQQKVFDKEFALQFSHHADAERRHHNHEDQAGVKSKEG